MTVEVVDGIKVMKLRDDALAPRPAASDMLALALAQLWQLLSGGHALRDGAVFARQVR